MFYDYNNLFSRNALFNFIIGERGVGKTYGILKKAVKDYIKNGDEFVYIRRYKTELKMFNQILDPHIANEEFKGHEVKIKGGKVLIDGHIGGYAFPLSTAVTMKSSSFPKVKTIIFDEFIIDKGNVIYINDEVTKFLEMYETIARMRDVKVYFLGNAITLYNPYFEYFNITIPYNSEFKIYKDGLILVNYIKNEEYREAKKKTKFGKLLSDTNYGKYAIDNELLRDNDKTFIVGKLPANVKILCNMIIDGHTLGVWRDNNVNYYVSNKYDPNITRVYSFKSSDHTEYTYLTTINSSDMFFLSSAYHNGRLYFTDSTSKYLLLSLIIKR